MNIKVKSETKKEKIRDMVRQGYSRMVVKPAQACCGGDAEEHAQVVGYSISELSGVPEGANLGLGCGNPGAIASLKPGDVVLDLGSGAGFDVLLAAPVVGPTGRVIGVDMTPEMLKRARENSVKAGYAGHVEFREGIIEELPVISGSIDVIISNCVINLSPDKELVFREAFRVLKPGGRLVVSDILLSQVLPESLASSEMGYIACLSGAITEEEYLGALERVGFVDLTWTRVSAAPMLDGFCCDANVKEAIEKVGREPLLDIAKTVFSYQIEAHKP